MTNLMSALSAEFEVLKIYNIHHFPNKAYKLHLDGSDIRLHPLQQANAKTTARHARWPLNLEPSSQTIALNITKYQFENSEEIFSL